MRRTFVATVLAAVAAVPALAAPPDQIQDPAGDVELAAGPAYDILSAGWSVSGRNLVARLTLAAPPLRDGSAEYATEASAGSCRRLSFVYVAGHARDTGDAANVAVHCGDTVLRRDYFLHARTSVHGRTITWTVPWSALPAEVRAATVFRDFAATTAFADPVFGAGISKVVLPADGAESDAVWRVS